MTPERDEIFSLLQNVQTLSGSHPYSHSKATAACFLLTYLHIYLLTPSWEANRFSASHEIPYISWNLKAHYLIYKSPPPVRILSQINVVYAPLHPTSWRSISILSSHLRLSLPSGLPGEKQKYMKLATHCNMINAELENEWAIHPLPHVCSWSTQKPLYLYRTLSFIVLFTRSCHWLLFWVVLFIFCPV
jgi:hypothetical protein